MPAINLNDVANNGKSLGKFVAATIKNYNNVAVQLHQAACMTLFHVAQFGECHALNEFHNGLRKNDARALRIWLGKLTQYIDLDSGSTKNWLTYSEKEGFRVVKGKEAFRKDMFTVTDEVEGKTCLITLTPFHENDNNKNSEFDLSTLVNVLVKAADKAEKGSEKNDIQMPDWVKEIISQVKTKAPAELDNIKRAKEQAEAA